MAADRTVPCDHSIRKESCWKAESVIGQSAARRDLRRLRLSRLQPNGQISLNYTKVILQGRKAPTEVRLHLLHSSQASWQSKVTKKARKGQNASSLFRLDSAQPHGGSHQAEFVFDVRQFGASQRARLHFSTPVLYRAAKNHKREIPQRKKMRTKFNLTALKIDNSSEV